MKEFAQQRLHAGLFSNALDLMRLMQLYLDNGNYLGKNILPEKEIKYFTSSHFTQYDNRRGVIFDKPSIDPDELGPTCDSISLSSFGHSGFTGTLAWADPEKELVYIFLSNGRVFPNGNNTKLIDKTIRTDIQQIIYNSKKLTVINDSKSTSFSSTKLLLESYENIYWLVGGLAKKGDKLKLNKKYFSKIKAYTYGKDRYFFSRILKNKIKTKVAKNLNESLKLVFRDSKNEKQRKIILFSPSAASFDQFKNFEVRGLYFNKIIKKYIS